MFTSPQNQLVLRETTEIFSGPEVEFQNIDYQRYQKSKPLASGFENITNFEQPAPCDLGYGFVRYVSVYVIEI